MKHNTKITAILIIMFLITQLIGLFVIRAYTNNISLPYGMQPPEEVRQNFSVVSILFAFLISISLFFILTMVKAERFIRAWFFVVTVLALGLSLNVILFYFFNQSSTFNLYASILALVIALPLAYIKIFKRELVTHNITELLIYPGIAAVLVPILNIFGISVLLLVISLYDIWAVWHSEFMQKMARYQIDQLKFFTGFFIPYAGIKEKFKLKQIRDKYSKKSDKFMEKKLKQAKIKVNLAILGGGDVIFPIIASGVFYQTYHSIWPSLIITAFSTLSLLGLFIFAKKGKFYPAMPFLTIGIYLAMIVSWLVF